MNTPASLSKRLRAAVVGGGIGGLSAACSLRRRGIDVTVFEQAETLGEIGAGLTIFPNSLRQLERMGLGEALAAVGAKIGDGSRYYRADGTVVGPITTTDSSGWNGVYGMHRADLLNVFAASLPLATIRTGHRCIDFEQNAVAARLIFANGETAEAYANGTALHDLNDRLCQTVSVDLTTGRPTPASGRRRHGSADWRAAFRQPPTGYE